MARNSGSPDPNANPNSNPGSPPPAPPPPPQSAPTGPTGTSGFSVTEGSLQTLQKYAGDLETGYGRISSQLSSQKLAVNALGVFGMPMVVAVNGSNDKSVDKAKHAAETMAQVGSGVKATAETQTNTDQFIAGQFGKIVPDSGAKNPQGAPNSAPPVQTQSGPQVSKVEPPPGTTDPAPTVTPTPAGPQVSKVEPPPGAPDTTVPAGNTPQGGPPVSQYTPPPGADTTSAAAAPTQQGGPPVGQYTPPPGAGNVPPSSGPTPPPGAPVGQYTPPPGAGNVPPPSVPTPQGGPQVNQYTPPPGAPGTTNAAAWTPPSIPDPVAKVPGVPGTNTPGGPMPSGPGPNGFGPLPDRPDIPKGRPPAGGPPRPGAVPNVPGVNGPPKGEFVKPPNSALDSLRPINDANPPTGPRTPRPGDGPVQGPQAPMPPGGPWPPGKTPDIPDVKPVLAPKNLYELLDERGYPGGQNLPGQPGPKADPAWPVTTIDGKPWTDLEDFANLPPAQRDMWINNLRNALATNPDGAYFWSGSVYTGDGERVSVMYEAEEQAHGMGRNTLEGMLDEKAIKMPGWGTDPKVQELWDSVSSSVAHGSSGEVYVLLGPSRRPDNVFDMNEFPILEQNDAVRKVIAIDLMNNNSQTVILDKGPKKP